MILRGDPVGDGGSSEESKRPKQFAPMHRPYPPIPVRELLPSWWRLVYPPGGAGPMGETFMRCAREEADAVQLFCLHCGQPRHERFRHEIRFISRRVPETANIAYQQHIWDAPGRYDFTGEDWDELTISPRLEPLPCRWGAIIERGIVGSLDRIR